MKIVCWKLTKLKKDNFKNFPDAGDFYQNNGQRTKSSSIFSLKRIRNTISESSSAKKSPPTHKLSTQYGPRYAPKAPVPVKNCVDPSYTDEKTSEYLKFLTKIRKKNPSLPRFESAIDTQEIYNHEKIFGNERTDLRELAESFQTWTLIRNEHTRSIMESHKLSFSTQVSSNCSRGVLRKKVKNKDTNNWISYLPRRSSTLCSKNGKRTSYSSADYGCYSESPSEITSISLKWRRIEHL